MIGKTLWGALAVLAVAVAGPSQAQAPADVARFVDPVSAFGAAISPGGGYIAYIRRTDAGQQIIVVDMATNTGRPIQSLARNLGEYNWVGWKNDNRLIVNLVLKMQVESRAPTGSRARRDQAFEARFERIVAMDRNGGNFVQMFEGQMRRIGFGSNSMLDPLVNDPNHILVAATDSGGIGVWRADINTGRSERVANGDDRTFAYATDGEGYPVIRMDAFVDNSGYRVLRRASGAQDWVQVLEARRAQAINSEDFTLVGAGPGPSKVYVLARPNGRDMTALYLFDTATGEYGAPLQESAASDVAAPWLNATTHQLIATCEVVHRRACRAREPAMQRHFGAIDSFFERAAEVTLAGMSADGSRWLLSVNGPLETAGYFVYQPSATHMQTVANAYPSVDTSALSPIQVVQYQSRDNTPLWAYVTARPGATGPRPMVVMPHGGPESRDAYGYDSFAQLLASRDYVVLQPNFRGGAGFGRAFADAGRGQWGLRMQDDVTDAVRHMIATGVADPQKICIVGASYGGYAALAGAALTADLYKCAVSIAGPTDLVETVRSQVSSGGGRGGASYHYWKTSIGDPGADGARLNAASPRRLADRITIPVLLIHGEADDVVPIRQSEVMQQALNGAGRQTRLIRLPEEGHEWDAWTRENRLTMYREVEAFLAQHLGR